MGTRRERQRQGQSDQKRPQDPEKGGHSRPAGRRQRQETEITANDKPRKFGAFLLRSSIPIKNGKLRVSIPLPIISFCIVLQLARENLNKSEKILVLILALI